MKLQQHNDLKLTLIIFLKKNLVLKFFVGKEIRNGFKMKFFKIQRYKNLKLTEMMFSGKVSHWGFGAKSGREFILFQFFCFCFFRGAQAMSRNHVFSCFKFLELFIRVHNHFFDWRDSIKKWLCKKVLERPAVQSISCFKVMKIFSCWVNEKRVSTVTINSLLVTFLEVMTYSVLINKNSHGVDGVHLSLIYVAAGRTSFDFPFIYIFC